MKKYLEQVKDRVSNIQVKFVQIQREENEHADRLAKAASAEHIDVHEIYTIKYLHIYIFSLTFMLFFD